MPKLHILTTTGDTTVEWDIRRAEAGDREAARAVREAERIFSEQLARGASAFEVFPERPAARLDSFDPWVEHILVVPRVVGG